MVNNSYSIRIMTRSELDIAVDWAAAEGWNPGMNDADCFYAADSQGFLVGSLNDEPIAAISAVKYGTSFGFIGFYLVKPEYRGKGFGIQIWNAALASLEGRVIGLDGVVEQQDNYRKSGFVMAHKNARYQGTGDGVVENDAEIISLSSFPFDTVSVYDNLHFPAERRKFLSQWIKQPNGVALGILQNRSLAGYGVLRPCDAGYKIGPMFADTPELAERIFQALRAHVPAGTPFFLDVPLVNQKAVDLARSHQMEIIFETARMYKGAKPALPLDRIFGVTTFELG